MRPARWAEAVTRKVVRSRMSSEEEPSWTSKSPRSMSQRMSSSRKDIWLGCRVKETVKLEPAEYLDKMRDELRDRPGRQSPKEASEKE